MKKFKFFNIFYSFKNFFHKYKFFQPNPAFENMTNLDGYWGAKIVMSFTNEQLAAAVTEANYSDPEAASYLVDVLAKRRDIIGKHWFTQFAPLEKFEIKNEKNEQKFCFKDLAIETGLEKLATTQYRYSLRNDIGAIIQTENLGQSTCIKLPSHQVAMQNNTSDNSSSGNDYWAMTLQLQRNSSGTWSKWVKIYLNLDSPTGRFQLVGIRRQD